MPDAFPTVSDAEIDVLKLLWKYGPATVRDLHARLRRRRRRWAYNTVLTLLSRLREKGYVTSEKDGLAYVFQAAVSRDELLQRRLAELADRVCDGTASPLVHALVQSRQLSPDDIAALRRLLDELQQPE